MFQFRFWTENPYLFFSSDSELKQLLSVQILNWKSIFEFQFRFWTETTISPVQILNWKFIFEFEFRFWTERLDIYNWSMSRSIYITCKHKLLQRKKNQNYNLHCFHFQYCICFLLWGTFHGLLVICQAWRPCMAKCQNSRIKMRWKKRTENPNRICVSWTHSAGILKFHCCK